MRDNPDFALKRSAEAMRMATTPGGGYPPEIERNVPNVGTGQITVTSTPAQVSYVDRSKLTTKLTQLASGVDVFWGTNANVTISNGDLLLGTKGAWVSIPRAAIIFVVCAAGSTTNISWAEAYDD